MAVLVADEEVHQLRLQVGAGIDAVARGFFQVLPQLLGSVDLAGTGKAGSIVHSFGRVFLQRAYEAGKLLAVLPQLRIVRNDDEPVFGMKDAGGFHQRIGHERPCREERGDQVLQQVVGDRALEFVPDPLGGILVEGANRVPAAVLSREGKGDGLPEPAGAQRRQAASDAVEVEDRDLDGGGPEIAVVAAVEPAFERPCPEPCPRNHRVGRGAVRRDGPVNPPSRGRGVFPRRGVRRNAESGRQREQDSVFPGKSHRSPPVQT